jgi:hypothetical protein
MTRRPKQRNTGWRLGGRNGPSWLRAPCAPNIKATTRADFELLKLKLRPDELPAEHPLHELWFREGGGANVAEARFQLHHLASDLRAVEGVDGARSLVKSMLGDIEGYYDYRYELRIAGSVARSTGQRLVRLGGKNQGADIEAMTRSEQLCGIACYRANPATPHLRDITVENERFVTDLAVTVGTTQYAFNISTEIEFDRFPVSESSRAEAIQMFVAMWSQPDITGARVTRGGVKVSRTGAVPTSGSTGTTRIAIRLPVPARERHRLAMNIESKMEREGVAWANPYSGVSVFAIEESDFSLGLDASIVEPLLDPAAKHPFSIVVTTWPFFVDHSTRGRYLVEDIDWFARKDGGTLDLGLHTFGQNTKELGNGHLLAELAPNFAQEEWEIVPMTLPGVARDPYAPGAAFRIRLAERLAITRRMTRLPLRDGARPTAREIRKLVDTLLPKTPEE